MLSFLPGCDIDHVFEETPGKRHQFFPPSVECSFLGVFLETLTTCSGERGLYQCEANIKYGPGGISRERERGERERERRQQQQQEGTKRPTTNAMPENGAFSYMCPYREIHTRIRVHTTCVCVLHTDCARRKKRAT